MRKLLLLLGCLPLLNACKPSFRVEGNIEHMPAQAYRLEELAMEENILVDSGMTSQDGQFQIQVKGERKEEGLYRVKFMQGKYVLLALSPGDKAVIQGDWNQLENYRVSGSQGSQILKGFLVNLRENITDIRTIEHIMDSLKSRPGNDSLLQTAQQDMLQIKQGFLNYVKQFADSTQSVACALFAANMINPAVEGAFVKQFYTNITKRFPASTSARLFAERYLKKPESGAITPGKDPGSMAPDFSAPTPQGDTLSLSSFRGKYVLIDFWASWCAPCRQENPTVVKAYQQFRDRNFTVLGVSLDTDQQKWKEAIIADKLEWPQVSELKGWASVIARNYKVESIPQNFLIGPDGQILASGLKGATLEKKLSEVLIHP